MHKYKKLLFSSLGSAFEYYDLAIYFVFAVAIGHQFFHTGNAADNVIKVFFVYIIGYLAKPIGAWGLGYIADIKGRAYVLKINMFLLSISTLALVLLPGYEVIGIYATVLFVFLRIVQSVAVGAEIPIAVIYSIENYPKRQGLVTGIIFGCLSLGIMLTSLVYFIISHLASPEFVYNYGWRIGFLVGAICTMGLYFLRRGIDDRQLFANKAQYKKDKSFMYIATRVFVGMLLIACIAMLTTQLYMFLPTYYDIYIDAKYNVSTLLLSGSVIMMISCFVGGFISDYFSKQKLMAFLVIVSIFLAPILYKNIIADHGVFPVFILVSIIMGMFAPTYNVIIANYFSPEYRGRGLGLAYNLGYLCFSSIVPVITISLISKTNDLLIPATLIMIAGVISLIGLGLSHMFMKKA